MRNIISDVREITEEKIFKTLGRGVPVRTTMNETYANTVKSILIIEQAVKQIPAKETEQSRIIEEHQDSSSVSNVPLQFDSGKIWSVHARYTNIVNSTR